jgi:hypothetical protein
MKSIQQHLSAAAILAMLVGLAGMLLSPAAAFSQTAVQPPPQPAVAPADRPSFLILGTFHFQGSDSDMLSTSLPDVQSEKRQKEMEQIVDALARFKPTKIAVEVAPGNPRLQELYDGYLKGERKLGDGELQQIGFRLARKMGHGQVWAVDYPADMDFDGVIKAAEKYGQKGYMEQAMAQGQAYMAGLTGKIAADPLSEVLRHMNDPQDLDKNHGIYLLMAQIGTAEDPKGAEVLNGWYRRNLMIYTNLVRLVESPGERVLLVIGAGHAKLLRDYLGSSPNLRLEDTLSYLPAR